MNINNLNYINIERSLNELGTDVFKLKPNSCKLVYRICAICKTEEMIKFRYIHVIGNIKCLRCSNQLNGKNNAEKISQSNIRWNQTHIPIRLGIKHTKEAKRKISENRTPHVWTPDERVAYSAKWSGINHPNYGKKHTPETIQKMRDYQKIHARKGQASNFYGKTYYAKCVLYTRFDGSIVKLKSGWEVKVAKFLDNKQIQWEYEKQSFPVTYIYKGQTKKGTYIPDFFLNDEIWEVKGYWRKDALIKFNAFLLAYPHIKIKLLQKTELRQMGIL